MLFRLLQYKNMAQEGFDNPKAFAKAQATDAIIGAMIVPILFLLGFLGFLFILSYTQLIGGPYGIAKFFFWFLVVVYGTVGYVVYKIFNAFKKALKKHKHSVGFESHTGRYRDAEIVQEK